MNFTLSNEMLKLKNGSGEGKMSNIHGNQFYQFLYARVTAGFVLSCHVSGFTFRIKPNTFVNVYHEFVNSTTASPF